MTLENQVVSLDLAKRLKELGVKQESLYVWVDEFPVFNDRVRLASIGEFKDRLAVALLSEEARALVETYSAFTVAELGEILPEQVFIDDVRCRLILRLLDTDNGRYAELCYDRWDEPLTFMARECESTEADARAKILIYILENNLIRLQ